MSWTKYYVATVHCFLITYNFILFFFQYDAVSLIKVCIIRLSATVQLVACSPIVQATQVQFTPICVCIYISNHHVYNGFGGQKNAFIFATVYLKANDKTRITAAEMRFMRTVKYILNNYKRNDDIY
jgi:hypothetical protein